MRRSPPGTTSRAAAAAKRTTRHAVAEWAVTILLLLFGMTTLVQAYVIPTPSMEGTLMVGDQLLVDKLVYAPPGPLSRYLLPYQEVRRGDIVVFRYPLDIRENYVKRIIGVPGDRIRFVDKRLILNGKSVDEPYVTWKPGASDPYLDNFPGPPGIGLPDAAQAMLRHVRDGELLVPPGQYFAMGDNRDDSADSRYWGFVPRENIIGKPAIVYWSYNAPAGVLRNGPLSFDYLSDVARHLFTRTRWDRIGRFARGYRLE